MASVTAFDRWHIHKHSKDALPLWYSASLVSYLALVYAAFSEDNKLCTLNHLHLIFILSNVFRYMVLISFQKQNIIGFRIIAEEYVTSILPKLGAGAMAVWNHNYTLHQTPFLDIIYFNHLILIFLESIRRNISLNFNKKLFFDDHCRGRCYINFNKNRGWCNGSMKSWLHLAPDTLLRHYIF